MIAVIIAASLLIGVSLGILGGGGSILTGWAVPSGSHCPDTRPAGPPTPAAEQRARQDVRSRLMRQFPDVPSESLAMAAAEAFAFFAHVRVRHYVPVLAFERASRQLSGRFGTRGERGGKA